MENENKRPSYFKPLSHHNCRRASFHDYKRPGQYMITINKAPGAPCFSTLGGNPFVPSDPPAAIPSPAGAIVDSQIHAIEDDDNFLITNHVVMPDHIHLLWTVRRLIPRELGAYVGLFKTRCTGSARKAGLLQSGAPLFEDKFNDVIAFTPEIGERLSHYITDNPRRRMIVMKCPELFSRVQKVRLNGLEFDVYGNFQLLRHPVMWTAIVSSRYTEEERIRHAKAWDETIRCGGVFVSPFISEDERKLRKKLLDEGGAVIRIVADGLTQRFKPHGEEFDLCAEGRCLLIGMPRESAFAPRVGRGKCLQLNDVARWIVAHSDETYALVGGRRAALRPS